MLKNFNVLKYLLLSWTLASLVSSTVPTDLLIVEDEPVVTAPAIIGYLNSPGAFCTINPMNGALSNCFTVPFSQISPTNSSIIVNNQLYVLSQNFSLPQTPYTLIAISIAQQTVNWTISIPPYGNAPWTGIYGLIGYVGSTNSIFVMVASDSTSYFQLYLVALSNRTITKRWSISLTTKPNAGTFDTQFLRMWYLASSFSFYNLPSEIRINLPNQFNIVTLVYNPFTHKFYGLAQAAQSVLLYSWGYDYPASLTLVGVTPNVQVAPLGTTNLDLNGTSLTFFSVINQIVTISIQDASLISMTNSLPFRLYTWSYMS